MTIRYNLTGPARKALVNAISSVTGADAKYLGAPDFAYQVDYFTIDRNGTVTFDDMADSEEIENLIEELYKLGFDPEPAEGAEEPEPADQNRLTVHLPAAGFSPSAINNLHSIINAKGRLLCKALGADALPIENGAGLISFPWFSGDASVEERKAYQHLITALCDMAKSQKRVRSREEETDNEKYAFRCFLLRLGFIGDEYKTNGKFFSAIFPATAHSRRANAADIPGRPVPPLRWTSGRPAHCSPHAEYTIPALHSCVLYGSK